jgi:hypothetical protein
MPFLCVFDIDDTLLRSSIRMSGAPVGPSEDVIVTTQHVLSIEVQHKLDELMAFFVTERTFYRFAIWTLGAPSYAQKVKYFLTRKYQLPVDFFLFVWSAAEVEDSDFPKDLRRVYVRFPTFNVHNTLLFDDNPDNVDHLGNNWNAMVVNPFEDKRTIVNILRVLRVLKIYYTELEAQADWARGPVLNPANTVQLLHRVREAYGTEMNTRSSRVFTPMSPIDESEDDANPG